MGEIQIHTTLHVLNTYARLVDYPLLLHGNNAKYYKPQIS